MTPPSRRVVRREPVDSDNRATVQLVYRTVDDLGGRMDAHFDGVKQRLDQLGTLPEKVADHETRITVLEDDDADRRDRFGRFIALSALVVSIVACACAALPLLT
jgi:hypothetical protein